MNKEALLLLLNFNDPNTIQSFMHDLNVLTLKYYRDNPFIKTIDCSKHSAIDVMTDISEHLQDKKK